MNTFVIQEHDALKAGWHHDFRLERDGVLKSWVVPKGTPEEAGVRRQAIMVGDHDIDYGAFEGEIPDGYGAGKVSIWDSGQYELKSWDDTKIEVTFHGKRLSGDYMLHWIDSMNSWLLWKR